MSRLADEAAYFGAVADGVESCKEEIESLRQQLAIVTNKLETAEACLAGDGALITGLKDDLAEHEKQVTLLRDAVKDALWQETWWRIKATEALAATEPKP